MALENTVAKRLPSMATAQRPGTFIFRAFSTDGGREQPRLSLFDSGWRRGLFLAEWADWRRRLAGYSF